MEDIQNYLNQEIGVVQSVDTKKVSVSVEKEEILNRLKINDIVVLSGNNADEKLIGIVTRELTSMMKKLKNKSIHLTFVI